MRKTHHTLHTHFTVLRVYDTGVKREHPAFFLVPVKHWIGYHDHLHTPVWSGSGCDVCSSCSRLTEHCTILSSVILKILKSATTNQTVTGGSGSNYSIRVLKENIANAMQYTYLLACLLATSLWCVVQNAAVWWRCRDTAECHQVTIIHRHYLRGLVTTIMQRH